MRSLRSACRVIVLEWIFVGLLALLLVALFQLKQIKASELFSETELLNRLVSERELANRLALNSNRLLFGANQFGLPNLNLGLDNQRFGVTSPSGRLNLTAERNFWLQNKHLIPQYINNDNDDHDHNYDGAQQQQPELSPPVNEPVYEMEEFEIDDNDDENNNNKQKDEMEVLHLLKYLHDNLEGGAQLKNKEALSTNDDFEDGEKPFINNYANDLEEQQQQHQVSTKADKDDEETTPTSGQTYGNSEYIDHPLALIGHQYVQGGAGEGRQLLGPDGTFENVQVIKSDSAVPSYCDPPNPCPIGYTAKDGCLERFVNSATFSREYQAKQKCSCDNEHSLFNCASPPTGLSASTNRPNDDVDAVSSSSSPTQIESDTFPLNEEAEDELAREEKLNTLARTIQNRFGDLDSVRQLIRKYEQERKIMDTNNDAAALVNDEGDVEGDDALIRTTRKWSKPLGARDEPNRVQSLD